MKAGFSNDVFGHIGSFRRQMYIHPEHSDKIPNSILVQFDQTEYRIFLSDDIVTCFLCKQTGHTSNHCKNILENKADSHFNISNTTPDKNDTDPYKQITQNTDGDFTDTEIYIEKITHITQENTAQEKRPAPSTSSSSCHENTSATPPNDPTPSQTKTSNIRINNGTLATKLKESAKTPQPLLKKPKRSDSIEQTIIKLDEAILPANNVFENIPNRKIEKNQTSKKINVRSRSNSSTRSVETLDDLLEPATAILQNTDSSLTLTSFKYILENFSNKNINIHELCNNVGSKTTEVLNTAEKVKPLMTSRKIKSKIQRLINLLFQSLPQSAELPLQISN